MKAKTILVVEDEAILGMELREDLQALGFEVPEVVPDGDRVLAAVVRHHPDLVIMDIMLYGYRDGIDAANQIMGFYDLPILFLSSHSRSEVEERLKDLPGAGFIEKPYDPEGLRALVEAAVAGRD